ncbi:uncharacterized protein LOC132195426 isoform X2 [Neocloeon triangulifer]|uniref:uncharacterized protein LOC132195426 isoform X2 n=1 Tax=Neocloeon triangulifer TaxID=2078957 RepID=UPI00286F6E59|nr:uncharacterized protein LOC132195426 isoform X2 [Neocloeon triangulifer]
MKYLSKISVLVTCMNILRPIRSQEYQQHQEYQENSHDLKINLTECWNYQKSKPLYPAPVFRAHKMKENLSFKDCGEWKSKKGIAPWQIVIRKQNRLNRGCEGLLISKKTIIFYSQAFHCYWIFNTTDDVDEIMLYGGECIDEKRENCFRRRNLLSKEVPFITDFQELELEEVHQQNGSLSKAAIIIISVKGVEFSDTLKPICLWNRDNQHDLNSTYIFKQQTDMVGIATKTNIKSEENCFEKIITKLDCDIYGKTICTSYFQPYVGVFLIIEREKRHFLRGLRFKFLPDKQHLQWIDLLPLMEKIVFAAADVAILKKTSELKPRIFFRGEQSFDNCGQVANFRRRKRDDEEAWGVFINGGIDSRRGQSPWHAGLTLHFQDGPNPVACGASLISKRVLITAAHCLISNGVQLEANFVEVILGMHNKNDPKESEHWYRFRASNITLHPDYKGMKNDIALIFSPNDISFSNIIRPICLWNDEYNQDKIINTTGSVVGWGYTTNFTQPNVLQHVEIKIASHETCYESSKLFFSGALSPNENFCAGFPLNRTGVCTGDSGGGLVIYNQADGRYFLRGIVSGGREVTRVLPEEAKPGPAQHLFFKVASKDTHALLRYVNAARSRIHSKGHPDENLTT